jgi:hypothetical protein
VARPLDELEPALLRLDTLLGDAVAMAQQRHPGGPAGRWRGLAIDDDEPHRLLARAPGALLLGAGDGPAPAGGRFAQLAQRFGLAPFDADLLLLALAPELDLRYERLYAYLQDDVTRRRPSVDLALDLLAADAHERLELRDRLGPERPLLAWGVVELVTDAHQVAPPLLAHGLRPADGVVRWLFGESGLDRRLAGWCSIETDPRPDRRLLSEATDLRAAVALLERGTTTAVALRGGDRLQADAAARQLASEAGLALLTADLGTPGVTLDASLRRALMRDAALHGALVHATCEGQPPDGAEALLADPAAAVVASGSLADGAADAVAVTIDPLTRSERASAWSVALAAEGVAAGPEAVEAVAGRFRLGPAQIATAARAAAADGADLFAAARNTSAAGLGGAGRKVPVRRTRDELILPPARMRLLDAIRDEVRLAGRVQDDWGFARTLPGAGLSVLFAGPPGTGKTLAAQVLAGDLGLDLYAIDLSMVVDKYIGETEKKLARAFAAAEAANAILFFDEADALFGARSEVRDSHDRYANIEVSYLLQRVEEYSGVAILASNLRGNIDDAFVRRLRYVVDFPLPDADSRRRIWEATWPAAAPHEELDFAVLGDRFDVTGATIRDAAVSAAYIAAADGGVVTAGHVEEAMRREYAKLGRVPPSNGRAHGPVRTVRA